MTKFTILHMRAEAPEGAINTCAGNGTASSGDWANWTWANPTNTAYRVTIAGTSVKAVSVECAWQGTKVLAGTPGLRQTEEGWFLSEEDFLAANRATLEGNWRRGKGRKPIGAWVGANRPLITDPVQARREIYLPAYQAQLGAMITRTEVQTLLLWVRAQSELVLRDHNTGPLEGKGAMSHARLLAQWIETGRV